MTTCYGSLGGATTNGLVSLCCTTPQGTKASATTVQSAFATTIIHSFHGSFTLAINAWVNNYLLWLRGWCDYKQACFFMLYHASRNQKQVQPLSKVPVCLPMFKFVVHSLAKMSVTMNTFSGSLGGMTTNRIVYLSEPKQVKPLSKVHVRLPSFIIFMVFSH